MDDLGRRSGCHGVLTQEKEESAVQMTASGADREDQILSFSLRLGCSLCALTVKQNQHCSVEIALWLMQRKSFTYLCPHSTHQIAKMLCPGVRQWYLP